jgi:hypothetical protein
MSSINTNKRKPPYRSASGAFFTKALFLEPNVNTRIQDRAEGIEPIFTLQGGKPGYIDARKTFVELEDPTGYKWAMLYLESWDHFEMLTKAQWFRDALEDWRREIDVRLASKGLDKLKAFLSDPDLPQAQAITVAKYLANKEYKEKAVKGRPSKADVASEMKHAIKQATIEDDDATRIGLRVVK